MKPPSLDPCTQTSIQAVFSHSDINKSGNVSVSAVTLFINNEVEVTTHALPGFQPLQLVQVDGSYFNISAKQIESLKF